MKWSLVLIMSVCSNAAAQHVSKIILSEQGEMRAITINLDEDVIVNVSPDGKITEWGTDIYKSVDHSFRPLQPYTGKTDTFRNDDAGQKGKIKIIGKTSITYFASYEDEALRGKIKSIGALTFEYFPHYENKAYSSRIKRAGSLTFTFYPEFGNNPDQGKLKSAGLTAFTYYGPFDDKAYKGKLKSIGSSSYKYYGSGEMQERRGHLKSGNYIQAVNGIKFVIRQ
jgi:hypothetical protein